MKISVLLMTAFVFIATANAQLTHTKRTEVKDAHDKYANTEAMELPEGTALKKGKVTLANGYRTVYLDSNRIIVVQKSNGETTGAFRCGCTSLGDRRVTFTGNEIHCVTGCNMDVTLGNYRIISQSGNEWKKIILPKDNIKRQKAGN